MGISAGIAAGASIVGSLSSVVGNIGGGKEKTGLPRQPISDSNFAQQLATKWYTLYLKRAPDTSGLAHWTREILRDGPVRAWANFSSSGEAMKANVGLAATVNAARYGSQFELAPGAGVPETTANPVSTYVEQQVDQATGAVSQAGDNILSLAKTAATGAGAGAVAATRGTLIARQDKTQMILIGIAAVVVVVLLMKGR